MYSSNGTSAAATYRQLDVGHEVQSATPYRLVQMLMERAIARIAIARGHMERGAVGDKGEQIGAAIGIINGLQASLNHKADSRLSGNFDALYDYMIRRLLEGNLRNEPSALQEVADLMREVKQAWDAIGDEVVGEAAVVASA